VGVRCFGLAGVRFIIGSGSGGVVRLLSAGMGSGIGGCFGLVCWSVIRCVCCVGSLLFMLTIFRCRGVSWLRVVWMRMIPTMGAACANRAITVIRRLKTAFSGVFVPVFVVYRVGGCDGPSWAEAGAGALEDGAW